MPPVKGELSPITLPT